MTQFIIILSAMSSYQYIGPYSDHGGKKVIKFKFNGVSYGRKYIKAQQGHTWLIEKLLMDRKASSFSCIKGPFDFNASNSSKGLIRLTFPFLQHRPLHMFDLSRLSYLTQYVETAFLTILRGQNEYFYSFQNMLINDSTHKLTFSPYSIIGIIPLYFRTSFSNQQFSQVFQLLGQEMFNCQNPLQYSIKAKFRAIGMLILHMIMKKRISLVLKGDFSSDQISFDRAKELVGKLKSRFQILLKLPYAIRQVNNASNRDKVDYHFFLRKVFIEDCEGMSWQAVKNWLIPNQMPEDKDGSENKPKKQEDYTQWLLEKGRLNKLGIFDSEPDIYNDYKKQISQLNSNNSNNQINMGLPLEIVTYSDTAKSNQSNVWDQDSCIFATQLKRIIPQQIYGRSHQARNHQNYGLSQSAYMNTENLVQSLLASTQWKQFMIRVNNQWPSNPPKENITQQFIIK